MLRPMLFEQTKPVFFEDFYKNVFQDMLSPFKEFNTDVIDGGDHYVVQAELPGFKKEDIHIEVEQDMLKISASHKEEVNEKKDNYIRQERRYNSYSRCFHVDGINKDNIKAEYKNGILEVKLPKDNSQTEQSKVIDIE